jgi:hypothetical protein
MADATVEPKFTVTISESVSPAGEKDRINATYVFTELRDGANFYRDTVEYFNLKPEVLGHIRTAIKQVVAARMVQQGYKDLDPGPAGVCFVDMDYAGLKLFERRLVKLAQQMVDFGEEQARRKGKKFNPHKADD